MPRPRRSTDPTVRLTAYVSPAASAELYRRAKEAQISVGAFIERLLVTDSPLASTRRTLKAAAAPREHQWADNATLGKICTVCGARKDSPAGAIACKGT